MTLQIINEFIESMEKHGCEPDKSSDINPDGKDNYYRLKDDKKDKRGGYCLTIESDGFAHGNFINFRTDKKGKWHSKENSESLSPEELKEIERRIEASELKRKEERIRLQNDVAKRAAEDLKKFSKADESNEYIKRKNIKPYIAKRSGDDLIIPMKIKEEIFGYQKILPDGSKYFLKNGRKEGCYCPLIEPHDKMDFIIVCEGFATGSTIREATDIATYIAFDAGNLLPVCLELKKEYPDAMLMICADNDHETLVHGKLKNIGKNKARQAALDIGGAIVVYPEFKDEDKSGKSDFNDLKELYGIDAVKDTILPLTVDRGVVVKPVVQDRYDSTPINLSIIRNSKNGDYGMPFKVLGYRDGYYYYYSFNLKEIVKLPSGGHTLMSLLQLGTLDQWEDLFIKVPTSKIHLYALDMLGSLAQKRGLFIEDDRIRGAGVWRDQGRLIFNSGNNIYVDGVRNNFEDIDSNYTYIVGNAIPELSTNNERKDFTVLRDIFSLPTWDNDASGVLIAGWIVIAPICSTLEFRPHIFITGQSNSGKSTIIEMIQKVLKGIALEFDGSSSEASIRSTMGYNANPVIFDEAEDTSGGMKVSSIDRVIELARLCSSGGTVKKYNQNQFTAQSCFCFSAINAPIKKSSDESRISQMILRRNSNPDAKEHFKNLCNLQHNNLTPEFSRDLMTHTINNYETIKKNIEILDDILRDILEDPRAAQIISPMLAGWHSLESTEILTTEEATKIAMMHDWSSHTAANKDGDPKRLVNYISLSLVKVNCGMSTGIVDVSIGELIACCVRKSDITSIKTASDVLKHYSIKVDNNNVFIGDKNHNLTKLLKNTDWGNNWKRTLTDLSGSKGDIRKQFASSDRQKSTRIPIHHFIEEEYNLNLEGNVREIAID